MPGWAPRPVDLVAAVILTVATQLELWLGPDPGASRAVLAVAYGIGTITAAWHRIAPLTTVTVCVTAMAVVPGALGVDPSASFGWLVTLLAVIVSAGYHSRRPFLALAIALVLVALSIVFEKGLVVADIAYAWLIIGGAWLAGRTIATGALRARLSDEHARRVEQEAHWRAAAAVTDERLRIARELHDLTAHSISVMTLHASGVRRLLRPDQIPGACRTGGGRTHRTGVVGRDAPAARGAPFADRQRATRAAARARPARRAVRAGPAGRCAGHCAGGR